MVNARLGVLLALLGAPACRQPNVPPVEHQTRTLGAGVTVAIDPARPPPHAARPGVLPMWVTLANRGAQPIQIKYRDFALADDGSASSLALLPTELGLTPQAARILPERLLGVGQSESGFLYFRLPTHPPGSLRVDLEAANDIPLSRNFVKLRVN